MARTHTVQEGECVSSIAARYGFFHGTLWDHPDNADLKKLRGDPNVLMPGDLVAIPDLRLRVLDRPTGQRHKFRRRGVPEQFRLRFVDERGDPRAGVPYELDLEGTISRGALDDDGVITAWIPPELLHGTLTLDDKETYELQLGHLDPVTERSGVVARLRNLRLLDAEDDSDEALVAAVRTLQVHQSLEATGRIDDTTRKALVAEHGS